jgi:hypothetical protein
MSIILNIPKSIKSIGAFIYYYCGKTNIPRYLYVILILIALRFTLAQLSTIKATRRWGAFNLEDSIYIYGERHYLCTNIAKDDYQ